MNKTQLHTLKQDLPPQAQQQIQLTYQIQELQNNLDLQVNKNGELQPTKQLADQVTKLRVKHKKLLQNKLELIRTQYAHIKQLDLELPQLLNPEYKELNQPDNYIQQQQKDIATQLEEFDEDFETRHLNHLAHTLLFRAEIQEQANQTAEAIQRAKKDWYQAQNLEPHQTRKNKEKTLRKHIHYTTKNLEQAARTLNQYRAHPIKKNPDTIKNLTQEIQSQYLKLAKQIGNPKTLIQQHREKTPNLNTILGQNPDQEPITKGIKKPQPVTQEKTVLKQTIEKYQHTEKTTKQQTTQNHIKHASESPYKKHIQKIPINQRPQILTRPTQEDHQAFWKHYIKHILATAGKAIPKPQVKQNDIE